MTPLLCACAVVITLETQNCRKRAPRSVEFNFFYDRNGFRRMKEEGQIARSMLNKRAKFHGDRPSGEKVKFNLARAIVLSETADLVYNFV